MIIIIIKGRIKNVNCRHRLKKCMVNVCGFLTTKWAKWKEREYYEHVLAEFLMCYPGGTHIFIREIKWYIAWLEIKVHHNLVSSEEMNLNSNITISYFLSVFKQLGYKNSKNTICNTMELTTYSISFFFFCLSWQVYSWAIMALPKSPIHFVFFVFSLSLRILVLPSIYTNYSID